MCMCMFHKMITPLRETPVFLCECVGWSSARPPHPPTHPPPDRLVDVRPNKAEFLCVPPLVSAGGLEGEGPQGQGE